MRSYLDSNCSQCHRPAGAPGVVRRALQRSAGQRRVIINGPVNNEFGVAGSKVTVPQNMALSLLHRRSNTNETAVLKMPPLARNVIDTEAVNVIAQWIGGLPISGSGLYGVYYDNMDFTGTAVTRTDATVDFNWGAGAPITGIGVGHVQCALDRDRWKLPPRARIPSSRPPTTACVCA